MPGEPEILVTGERISRVEWLADARLANTLNLFPSAFLAADPMSGLGGVGLALIDLSFSDRVFRIDGLNIRIRINASDWNKLSSDNRIVLERIIQNNRGDQNFREALEFLDLKGVTEIHFNVGHQARRFNGESFDFLPDAYMQISYDYDPNYPDATHVRNNSIVVININESQLNQRNAYEFAQGIAHEIMHPWVPDEQILPGVWTDHHVLNNDYYSPVIQAVPALIPDANFMNTSNPFNVDVGLSTTIVGSVTDDTVSGSAGSDVFAGMAGNDVLAGGGGSNVLYGGIGQDTLISSGLSDLLLGGTEADSYILASGSRLASIIDHAGVDRLLLSGSFSDYIFQKIENSFLIIGTHQTVVLQDVYLDSRAVELFSFNGEEYAWGYLDYVATYGVGGTGTCYDEYGQPYFCANFAAPVGIDLAGDGLTIRGLNVSNVHFDVDQDGRSDRIAWVGDEDAVLWLDRDSSGTITDFSELTFIRDLRGAGSDFEGLLAFDTDRDGFLTMTDDAYANFGIWQDSNGNGWAEAGELSSLAALGLKSINLEIAGRGRLSRDGDDVQVIGRGSAFGIGDRSFDLFDLFMRYEAESSLITGGQNQYLMREADVFGMQA